MRCVRRSLHTRAQTAYGSHGASRSSQNSTPRLQGVSALLLASGVLRFLIHKSAMSFKPPACNQQIIQVQTSRQLRLCRSRRKRKSAHSKRKNQSTPFSLCSSTKGHWRSAGCSPTGRRKGHLRQEWTDTTGCERPGICQKECRDRGNQESRCLRARPLVTGLPPLRIVYLAAAGNNVHWCQGHALRFKYLKIMFTALET